MEDTIAAISTSTVSSGGISVVRISGENALSVAQQVFRSKKNKNVVNKKVTKKKTKNNKFQPHSCMADK